MVVLDGAVREQRKAKGRTKGLGEGMQGALWAVQGRSRWKSEVAPSVWAPAALRYFFKVLLL